MFETLFKFTTEEFRQGLVRFATSLRPELALAAVIVAALVAVYFYRRSPQSVSRRLRLLLSGLRGLALALLVIILFHPVLKTPTPVTRDTFVAVLVDDSRSMRIEDAGALGAKTAKDQRKTRLAAMKELLGKPGEGKLLDRLSETSAVRQFKFSGTTKAIKSVDEVIADGDRTNLYQALKSAGGELRGVPLVAVIMLTDGALNTGGIPSELAEEFKGRGTPIYTVGFGDANPPNDFEILRVQAPREVRNNTAVDVFAFLRAGGFTQPFDVIFRQDKKELDRVKVTPDPEVDVYRVRLSFQPESKSALRYTVEIPASAEEVITDNNKMDFLINVIDKRLPVLYLEGSPREEYRFLRRALFRDKDFRIASILRVEGPKKFLLQGAEDEDGLKDGFPKKLEHLNRFEAVILGDVEAGYLSKEQLDNIEQFVKVRGGGFLMLGGMNSFNLGGYQGTNIEKMLPVVLPPADVQYDIREFNLSVTKLGEEHLIMRQNSNVLFNRNIWAKAPTLIGVNPIKEVKPGAEVLAVEPRTNSPLLVVQKYGAGRSAAFATGGSWHWRMALPVEDELHEKFWKQFVRWLSVGAKGKITIELDKDLFALKEPVAIRTTVLSNVMQPVNDAKVVARITDTLNNTQDFGQEWILSQEGVYQTQYEPPLPGDYKIEAMATLSDGSKLSEVTTFSVGETLDEYSDAGQKVSVLKSVADKSDGKYLSPDKAGQIADDVKRLARQIKKDETVYESKDIWDTALLFGVMALALSAEWFLRRRAGMM